MKRSLLWSLLMLPLLMTEAGKGYAQGIFESSVSGTSGQPWSLSGNITGSGWFGNRKGNDDWQALALYGGGNVNLKVQPAKAMEGKLTLRFLDGMPGAAERYGTELREAWCRFSGGPVAVTLGQQIVAWGRADGINPTDRINPLSPLFHSPDPDDLRLGNFMIQSRINLGARAGFHVLWIPVYRPSELPLDEHAWPLPTAIPEVEQPASTLKNSTWAAKLDLSFSNMDGSISWFDGYQPMPALQFKGMQQIDTSFVPEISLKPFRERVLGLDFAATPGKWGIRGEAALRMTRDYETLQHIALPDLQWVLGLERSVGELTAILQYAGYRVLDYIPVKAPDPMVPGAPATMINFYNRLIFRQTEKFQQALYLHLSWMPLTGSFGGEATGSYNLTTRESLLRFQVRWKVADGVQVTAGWQNLEGRMNTQYQLVEESLSGFYFQGKIFF